MCQFSSKKGGCTVCLQGDQGRYNAHTSMASRRLSFHKYQGLGNDFVLIGEPIGDPEELSRLLCRRRFGVGSDGLIIVRPDPDCAARMEFYNPDGSRAEMCGNGLRCVARFLVNEGRERSSCFRIMTDAGPKTVSVQEDGVAAVLGEPAFAPDLIPARLGPDEVLEARLPVACSPPLPPATCLSLGNPHCVFFVENVAAFPVDAIGPLVEHLPVFPERINVEFAERTAPGRLVCRVWERGAGETKACGTGAAATLIAATVRGLVPGEAVVTLPGGDLTVLWPERKAVTIRGSAEEVFQGSIVIPEPAPVRSCPDESSSPRGA